MSTRQFDPAGFIEQTLATLLVDRKLDDCVPSLGVDEGLNNEEYVGAMCRRLMGKGIVSGSTPLWYQLRKKADGEVMNVLGSSLSRTPLTPDIGTQVRGSSWPDEGVVTGAVCSFLSVNRVCLLTANTKNDKDGLRYILETEVRPAIERLKSTCLGLLVLAQTPRSGLREYCEAVEAHLRAKGVAPGYAWIELPN